jgi:hypothetical protein
LIYVGAFVDGWRVLPGEMALKLQVMLGYPAVFLALVWSAPLIIAPLRRQLSRYVWTTFLAGFGQTRRSLIGGLGLLIAAAVFIFWQIEGVSSSGRYPVGAFAGCAAGLGVLFAQAMLTRRLEREPDVQAVIDEA